MNHRVLRIALVGLILGARSAGAQSPPAGAGAVDPVIAEALRDKVFAGATVGIAAGGKIQFVKGYGMADLENRVGVTDSTVFRIGSTTKQFTAVAILKLMEQGKLSLDDPLSKYRPEFPRASEVTVRQLLNHTSGIMSYTHPKVAGQIVEVGRRSGPRTN